MQRRLKVYRQSWCLLYDSQFGCKEIYKTMLVSTNDINDALESGKDMMAIIFIIIFSGNILICKEVQCRF